jgi:hypothetical protein
MFNFEGFMQTLPIMLYGMAGIFAVIIVIYLSISIMNIVFKKKGTNEQ